MKKDISANGDACMLSGQAIRADYLFNQQIPNSVFWIHHDDLSSLKSFLFCNCRMWNL